ncbi:MAG: alkane 1-monooxygenase [Spirochaetaceae bacterium]|nr:MAG: alkane 1-monooxygenase [Spirochaetaceae bacterium]
MNSAPFVLVFSVPAALAAGVLLGGGWAYAVPVYVFIVVPIADRLIGDTLFNPERSGRDEVSVPHLSVLIGYALVQIVVLAWVLWSIASGVATGVMPRFEAIGLAAGLGVMNGAIGITVAHEFIHRSNRFERAVGVALLSTVWYAHFRIEHVQGHHANVGTPLDPATARRGQSVYSFWVQSVFGGVKSAWQIEARRLSRMDRGVVSLRNRMIGYALLQVAITIVVAVWLGPVGLAAFVGQAILAFSLLEVVNYIEHYGLERSHNGRRYARVAVEHSWDSPRRLTNYLLINLQRHADHHASPQHRYQVLHHVPAAPKLPSGYAEMVLLALLPRLWYARIDPLLAAIPVADAIGIGNRDA